MVVYQRERIDIPAPVRGFQRFDSETRANHRASHRLGFRQRERIGEAFWTHAMMPNIAFPSRIAAVRAVLRLIGHPAVSA